MAALETRLLLLGAVSLFAPVNGYQLRRELLSWRVDSWANIQPGSIYNGLSTLARRGDLIRHDLRDGGREVAVYELSDQGREEFTRLFETAITTVTPTTPVAFQTAMSLLPLVTRDEAIDLLRRRLDRMDDIAEEYAAMAVHEADVPPHVNVLRDYWERVEKVEREWLTRLLFRLADGELSLAGDPWDWTPREDDPGWQMQADRERYLALLGR